MTDERPTDEEQREDELIAREERRVREGEEELPPDVDTGGGEDVDDGADAGRSEGDDEDDWDPRRPEERQIP
jgi:hypothetical protein